MNLASRKITNFSKPVAALPDRPTMSAQELKEWFDSNTTVECKTAINAIIDDLVAQSGSGEIGAAAISTVLGTVPEGTVKSQLEYIAATLNSHAANTQNPHSVTKAQVGLGNADNTADADNPVSTAAQAALNLKANTLDVEAALANKVDKAMGKDLSSNDYTTTEKNTLARAMQYLSDVPIDETQLDTTTIQGNYLVASWTDGFTWYFQDLFVWVDTDYRVHQQYGNRHRSYYQGVWSPWSEEYTVTEKDMLSSCYRPITLSTETTPQLTLTTRRDYEFTDTLTSLHLVSATKPTDGKNHEYSVKFKTGASSPTVTVPVSWHYRGDGCTGGAWTTVFANKYYELHGAWVLDKLVWVVSAV